MSGTPATPIPPNSIIRGVVEYINEHFSAPLSLDLLAERFNISKSYLCHKFKETYNCSIYQYVQYQRISKAKELLASGISSTDAAYQCGFSDYSTFLRAFHKLVNDTPTGYKSTMAELPHP